MKFLVNTAIQFLNAGLPEVKPMLLPQTMIPEESFSPLLTPKGFVMPNMFSPYIQKMGPFPPPPNPVEIGLPITMSSSNPNSSTTEKPTAMVCKSSNFSFFNIF